MEISYTILCKKNPFLKELQSTFQNLHFDTALAGGCLRDTLLDKPIADYDVFYCGNIPTSSLMLLGFVFEELSMAESYEDNGKWNLTHQAIWQGKKIQFIKCHNSSQRANIISKFPNSIGKLCMYWNHLSPVGITQFKTSVINKQIVWDGVYVNPDYLGKIVKKYLEWNHTYKVGFTEEKPVDPTPDLWDTSIPVQSFWSKGKTVIYKAPEPKKYRILNASKELYKEEGWL